MDVNATAALEGGFADAPKDAARIFEDLAMDTLLEVAERMAERKLAPVMAKMNPEKARAMTVELSQLRRMPSVGAPSGG